MDTEKKIERKTADRGTVDIICVYGEVGNVSDSELRRMIFSISQFPNYGENRRLNDILGSKIRFKTKLSKNDLKKKSDLDFGHSQHTIFGEKKNCLFGTNLKYLDSYRGQCVEKV